MTDSNKAVAHKHSFEVWYRYDDFEGKGRPSLEIHRCTACGLEMRVVEEAVKPDA